MKRMRNEQEGYFTVEASLILPIVFVCILLVVYLGFFQYDRCALEQKMNLITLISVSADCKDSEEKVSLVRKYMAEPDDRFLALGDKSYEVSVKKGKMRVVYQGTISFPFQSFLGWKKGAIWKIDVSSEGIILNPVLFVRNYRKIKGGLSNGN